MKPIETAPIVPAIIAFAAAPESGLSPAQREACNAFASILAKQSHVDAAAISDLWFEARGHRLISIVAEHTFRALSDSWPEDFARAAMRFCGYETTDAISTVPAACPDPMERVAAALELFVLKSSAGSYTNEAYVTACTDAIQRVIRNATDPT